MVIPSTCLTEMETLAVVVGNGRVGGIYIRICHRGSCSWSLFLKLGWIVFILKHFLRIIWEPLKDIYKLKVLVRETKGQYGIRSHHSVVILFPTAPSAFLFQTRFEPQKTDFTGQKFCIAVNIQKGLGGGLAPSICYHSTGQLSKLL